MWTRGWRGSNTASPTVRRTISTCSRCARSTCALCWARRASRRSIPTGTSRRKGKRRIRTSSSTLRRKPMRTETGQADAGIAVARDYYDSAEADDFYANVWGGEDIHIGLYDATDDIRTASRLTVDRMIGKLGPLAGKRVIDLGAGYGGAARVLAGEHAAHVTCLNLSAVENERNRALTAAAGLGERITVGDGSYDAMPFGDASFDVAWSQDAILHAPDRGKVLDEAARVLKPGGLFAFTDPMQADDIEDTSVLQPIYDRIHLPDLASIGYYREALGKRGFE